ncbi:MAG TPA: hypothetical protein ENJ80_13570 [Gammaproteobacteria bacterium]|nr:hypothetical protein [Gammaproteobacteria bacterium]
MQLSVPNRTAPKNGCFDSSPEHVKTWIDALPMANIGATTRLLFEALTDLNHQDIPARQRFKTLELLCKPVRYVTEHMKKHFVGQHLPLTDKSLKIAHLAGEINHALATGYKVLVMEQIAGIGRHDRKLLINAIHRAIKQLSAVLLKAYQIYEPYPDSVWLEVHSLYRYAESNRLHKTRVSGDQARERNTSTIADAYKQTLLLALACPYRLRHNEAEEIYQALEEWARFSELRPVSEAQDALFSTNLDSDQPPSYLVLRDANENCRTCRVLATRKLAEHLRKLLGEKTDSKSVTSHRVKPDTLRRLMLAWGVMPKRRYSRVRDHSQVVVAMGLSSIHYFVSGEVAFNNASMTPDCHAGLGAILHDGPHLQDAARFQAKTTHDQEGELPDVWEMDFHLEDETPPTDLETTIARAAAGMQIDTKHCTQSWKMVNVSAGGYCLLWDNPETTRAQVGELLGIRDESDPDTFHWRLGIIRWLKFTDKRGLDLGVQMLSPGAVGIAARPDKKGRVKNDAYTRGLLLPEIASIQQQATLLLPSPPFRIGDTAIANCHGRDVRVKLTRLVENTGSFAQFQFTSMGEVSQPPAKKPAKQPKPKDFDDVWELL